MEIGHIGGRRKGKKYVECIVGTYSLVHMKI